MEGVEPTHSHEYQILSLARLPIPPHRPPFIRYLTQAPRQAQAINSYFPMQNWLKIMSSKSSVVVLPTISPTALTAMWSSKATSSRG